MAIDTSDMTAQEARAHIARLGVSQVDFARIIRVSPQNVRKWLKLEGEPLPIPRAVQIVLRIITPGQVRKLLAEAAP
jgi:DNA-binding transcriptional regulator YiaG